MTYRIRPLDTGADVAGFECGKRPLDEYLRRYASQDVRRDLARVFVATPEASPRAVAGYFTLSAGSVSCTSLPERLASKLPRYPIPVALIGRLAVAREFQGKGLGSILLAKAVEKVIMASEALAVAGIVVDAKDDEAVGFYRHLGFLSLQGQPHRLLLPRGSFPRLKLPSA